MACDTAFRIVTRRHLDALSANHQATCSGDPTALHQMRVALTHLRTAILFFSPMVHDAVRDEVRDELKWLNSELGAVRDLDVAVDRVKALDKKQANAALSSWNEKRAEGHRNLMRMLNSVRYRWLIDQTSGWVENGPWSTNKGKQAARERASPIGAYSAEKLEEWEGKLLKRSRKLSKMGTKKRHRLRLFNKKSSASSDSAEGPGIRSKQFAVRSKEGMWPVEFANRHLMGDELPKSFPLKPGVEVKGRRLDLEGRPA
jgi:CHAD domain-containing protein